MKTLLLMLILAMPLQIHATTYYWFTNGGYYPVGTVNDGDPQGFFSSTSFPVVWAAYREALRKNPY